MIGSVDDLRAERESVGEEVLSWIVSVPASVPGWHLSLIMTALSGKVVLAVNFEDR